MGNGRRHELWILISMTRGPRTFSPRRVSVDRPRSTRASQCGLGVVVFGPTRGARLLTPSAEARTQQHRGRLATRFLEDCNHRVRISWRVSCALSAPHRIGRPPTEHAGCTVRTWRGCVVAQTRGTLLPTPSAEARPHQHRRRSAARYSNIWDRYVRILWCAARAVLAP